MMEEEKFELLAMDFLAGTMNEVDAKAFEELLLNNPGYKERFLVLKEGWAMMDAMESPEPSNQMDGAFYEMLNVEMEQQKKKTSNGQLPAWLTDLIKPQWAFGMLLLIVGLTLGYFLAPSVGSRPEPQDMVIAQNETEEVRQKLVLTLLDQPSANQRLQGVSEANKFQSADSIVIKALLQTLNRDADVNVRLAAIESLTNYVDNPMVRQGLVQSIPNQESPLLQITLANLMVALQEKASIAPFKQLLKEKQLDTTVKKRIEKTIESII
ncbi:HEAT repeat domain-containing protein [Flagellimonas beolgyonensis]|uniref:HEAT repeat domain-containing protein n=1 Tax=Flagellimonas beolgyonensis TaxID=864064 RepID=UPI000F8DD534|nr:HEAT repeat domain-containing protein [Allomuricauda beolgyonensis]